MLPSICVSCRYGFDIAVPFITNIAKPKKDYSFCNSYKIMVYNYRYEDRDLVYDENGRSSVPRMFLDTVKVCNKYKESTLPPILRRLTYETH